MRTWAMSSRRRHERGSPSERHPAGDGKAWALAWSEADGLRTLTDLDAIKNAYADKQSRLWIDLVSPDGEVLAALTKLLRLHHLVTEDILERNQRAKIE